DQPSRYAAAVWFSGLFLKFGFGAGVHLRRIHYRIVSAETPVTKPDGTAYENTDRSWKYLVNASRDARYLDLVPSGHFVDRRNPDPEIFAAEVEEPATRLDSGDLDISGISDEFPELPGYRLDGYGRWSPPSPYLLEIW